MRGGDVKQIQTPCQESRGVPSRQLVGIDEETSKVEIGEHEALCVQVVSQLDGEGRALVPRQLSPPDQKLEGVRDFRW